MFTCDYNPNAFSYLFWAWNEILTPERINKQMEAFKAASYKGVFMHSRDGLETPYLSPEWDKAITACATKAASLGMEAWLYDEDRFPSGTCSGSITQKDSSYALHGLTIEVSDEDSCTGDIKAKYLARVDGDTMHALRRITEGMEKEEGEKYLIVRYEQSRGSVWFNGGTPPDNLNPETVKAFIASTHAHYDALDLDHKVVKGIFTDEPSLADRHAAFDPQRSWIPYSEGMDAYFKALNGYAIYDTLPYYFFNGEQSAKIRYDYARTVAQRFEEVYSCQIGAWCRAHNLLFTGHYLQEDKLGLTTRVNGSIMPHYTHEDIPGVDLLTKRCEEFMTICQAASVAHQYGKRRVLAETYAATGWDFSLTEQKWIGDWQYALGITNRVEHLSLYSLRGSRKRDYPPSFNTHNTSFAMQGVNERYFAGLSSLLQEGKVITDALIIHPISSVWTHFGSSPYGNPVRRNERDLKENDEIGYALNELLKELYFNQLSIDLGDETLIRREGYADGDTFFIKDASYRTIILPSLENLYATTLHFLLPFEGQILVLGDFPHLIDGLEGNQKLEKLKKKCLFLKDSAELIAKLKEKTLITLSHPGATLLQKREDGNELLLFFANNSREDKSEGIVHCQKKGAVYTLDPLSGERKDYPFTEEDDGISFDLSLACVESKVFIIDTSTEGKGTEDKPKHWDNCHIVTLPSSTNVSLDRMNALTLDKAEITLDGNLVRKDAFIWIGDGEIRKTLGMFPTDTDEIPQRYVWVHDHHPGDGHAVAITYTFLVDDAPETPVYLATETPKEFTISLNGIEVANCPEGYYQDEAFALIRLPSLASGVNHISLTTRYHLASQLEAAYLVGDFGVSTARHITAPVTSLSLGTWTDQGLFHYPGVVTYHYTVDLPQTPHEAFFHVDHFTCSTKYLVVNGQRIDAPWDYEKELDIREFLCKGENKFELALSSSMRNLLGQFHLKGGSPMFNNPASYAPKEEETVGTYSVHPYGLWAQPYITLKY